MRNEFMMSNSVMQNSVIDMQRDEAFSIATNQVEIIVENKTPGQERQDLTINTLGVELDYFWVKIHLNTFHISTINKSSVRIIFVKVGQKLLFLSNTNDLLQIILYHSKFHIQKKQTLIINNISN